MTVRALSFHAEYGCRNRGRCCTSGWPIAVEAADRDELERVMASGRLTPERTTAPVFVAGTSSAEGALIGSHHGRCVFHDDHASGGCRIHRAMGHAAMPLACRQFPRQSVRDPRGVSVTLSHYCPTAQDLLVTAATLLTIVNNAAAFPADAEYVGLTADPELPPLLHARLAMDWESWWLFEELSVSLLAEAPAPLARLGLAVEYARAWTVEIGPLSSHVRDAFVHARQTKVSDALASSDRTTRHVVDALAAVPQEWRAVASDALSAQQPEPVDDGVRRRFLAAHAFANWAAYQGEGLRTWFRSIEAADALLTLTRDPGRTDLVLRHLADSASLTARWNEAERSAIPLP